MRFFVVTGSKSHPIPAIYHDEPPRLYGSEQKGQRLSCGALVISGPTLVPVALETASLDDLLSAWKAMQAGGRLVLRVPAR